MANDTRINITMDGRCHHIQTYGGEVDIEGYTGDNYGIGLDGVFIEGIRGDDMERLAQVMIEHLKANGRDVTGRD